MRRCGVRTNGRSSVSAFALRVAAPLVLVLLVANPSAAEERRISLGPLLAKLDIGQYDPGDVAPGFRETALDGRPVSLSGLRGRVVIVAFWATWCPPCREELPAFERLLRSHGSRGLAVVAVDTREAAGVVRPFVQALGLTFPVLLDVDGEIARQFGVIGLPTTFVIDRNGAPVGRAIGPRAWEGEPARALFDALLGRIPIPEERKR
jgi:peroxiredoxin